MGGVDEEINDFLISAPDKDQQPASSRIQDISDCIYEY
jgi:hypothetical protein